MAKSTPKKTTKARNGKPAARAAKAPPARAACRKAAPAPRKAAAKPPTRRSNGTAVKSRPAAVRNIRPQTPPAAPVNGAAAHVAAASSKNGSGLKPKDLKFFRDLLLSKKRELLGDVSSMEEEALRSSSGSNLSNLPIHMADMGTDNYEQEFTLGLVQKDREILHLIHAALKKIDNGTYGICEGTGKPISRARLEAQPWARHSIEYARQMEKRLVRG